jgi:hypothetical protein
MDYWVTHAGFNSVAIILSRIFTPPPPPNLFPNPLAFSELVSRWISDKPSHIISIISLTLIIHALIILWHKTEA